MRFKGSLVRLLIAAFVVNMFATAPAVASESGEFATPVMTREFTDALLDGQVICPTCACIPIAERYCDMSWEDSFIWWWLDCENAIVDWVPPPCEGGGDAGPTVASAPYVIDQSKVQLNRAFVRIRIF